MVMEDKVIVLVREPLAGSNDLSKLDALGEQDRVVFCLPSGERLARGLMRCWEGGFAACAVHPHTPEPVVAEIAERVGAAAVWDERGLRVTGRHTSPHNLDPVAFMSLADPRRKAGETAVFGSAAVGVAASALRQRFLAPGAVHLSCVPLYTVAGYLQLVASILGGGKFLHCLPAVDGYADTWRGVFAAGCAHPGVMSVAVDAPAVRIGFRTPEPRNVVLTGDCLDCQRPPWPFGLAWGPDEMSGFAFCSPAGATVAFVGGCPALGTPAAGVAYRVVDGMLQLRGRYAFQGYLDPGLTAAGATFDGWLHTGHPAELSSNYLTVRPKVHS